MKDNTEYLLGVNQTELQRLEFQHHVWKKVTDNFFDRIKVEEGWKCLDVGAGPGFVSMDLRERVGSKGEITAIEPSDFYLNHLRRQCELKGWTNFKFILGKAEDVKIENGYFDFIFLRWVIDFVSAPEKLLTKLLQCLRKGGTIAIQDYAYEGITLFPKGGPFDNIAAIVRNYFKSGNGDANFTVKIPSIFREHNVILKEFTPIVIAGGPESDIIEWAHRFFTVHLQLMADKQVISQKECDELLEDWLKHRHSQDTIFFSPIMVDVAGIKEAN